MIIDIVSGIYSILLGVSLIIFWIIVFYKKDSQKYITLPLERNFHVIAEYIMSFLAIICGIGLLSNKGWGRLLFILTMGFVIYATINALGIYAHKKYWILVATLIGITIISTILVIFILLPR